MWSQGDLFKNLFGTAQPLLLPLSTFEEDILVPKFSHQGLQGSRQCDQRRDKKPRELTTFATKVASVVSW